MTNVSLVVVWDGIRNHSSAGTVLPGGAVHGDYECTKRWSLHKFHTTGDATNYPLGDRLTERLPTTEDYSKHSAISFTPYEELLAFTVPCNPGRRVTATIVEVYEINLNHQNLKGRLVYKEKLGRDDIVYCEGSPSGIVRESEEEFNFRTSAYCGQEDFVDWMQRDYCVHISVHYGSLSADCLEGTVEHFQHLIRAKDFLSVNYNLSRDPEIAGFISDFSRIQRLLRNKAKFLERLEHLEKFLERNPEQSLLQALEHYEDIAHFPTTQAVPLGLLPADIYSELVGFAYALNDVGVRSCHGGLTHRIQWHAIISLITNSHTVPLADGFYHAPLELYCAARGSLFQADTPVHQRCRVGECKIDLWRFLFDRFDKHAVDEGFKTELLLDYPEKFGDEMHYAEQAHMAIMNLPSEPLAALAEIDNFARESSDDSLEGLTREDVWMKRYLSGMSHPENVYEDPRLGWGCLLTDEEWRLLNERFDAIRAQTAEHRQISLVIRSYFAEAVVAVRVVTRLFENPSLVPEDHAFRGHVIRDYGSTPKANILEDIAPRLRISLLSSRRNERGELLFKPIESSNGSDAGCLIPSGSEQLTRDSVEALKRASRVRLRPQRSIPPRYCGVTFP